MSEIKSKYPEADEPKISIGPVFAINPRYVKRIRYVAIESSPWLEIQTMGNKSLTTELESNAFCAELISEFLSRNPDIEVERFS